MSKEKSKMRPQDKLDFIELAKIKIVEGQNPRRINLKSSAFGDLVESIRAQGVIVPVHVRTTRVHVRGDCEMKTQKRSKVGRPAFTWIETDGTRHVMSWHLSDQQWVPAIEESRFAVVRFPIVYYQHFDFCPEAMALRPERIKELGWSSQSFDLPVAPVTVGSYSLLSDSLEWAAKILETRDLNVARIYPSLIKVEEKRDPAKSDYCLLFPNHHAYEFYHFFFILGQKDKTTFENIPNPQIETLSQALTWIKSFEYGRRLMYRKEGFTWEPYREKESAKDDAVNRKS